MLFEIQFETIKHQHITPHKRLLFATVGDHHRTPQPIKMQARDCVLPSPRWFTYNTVLLHLRLRDHWRTRGRNSVRFRGTGSFCFLEMSEKIHPWVSLKWLPRRDLNVNTNSNERADVEGRKLKASNLWPMNNWDILRVIKIVFQRKEPPNRLFNTKRSTLRTNTYS